MRRFSFLTAAVLIGSVVRGGTTAPRVPVLLELFTSEGCSSCPPADKFLEQLDREQPVAGTELIVLSEHVDYWNHEGWKDPFSSAAYSRRQREYAAHLKADVYTPELVVNGAKGVVGTDTGAVKQAIEEAVRAGVGRIGVAAVNAGNKVGVSIRMDSPANGAVYVAAARDSVKSQVNAGENAGRGLSHVAVVYSLTKAPKGTELNVPMPSGASGEKIRIIVFSALANGQITAVGQTRL